MLYENLDVTLSVVLAPETRIDIPDRANPPAGIPREALASAPDCPALCAFPIPEGVPLPPPASFGFGESQASARFPVVSVKPEGGLRRYLFPAAFPAFPLQSCDAGFIDSLQIDGGDDRVRWPASQRAEAQGADGEPDLMLHGFYRYEWADSVISAKATPEADGSTTLVLDHAPYYGMIEVNRCRLVNTFHALVPGHYYLDRARRLLFLAEVPDGVLTLASEIAGPRFDLENEDGVTFRNCEFHDIRCVAVRARNCRDLAFEDCVFECIGGHVLDILDCANFRMERCRVRDTSAGAVYVKAGDRRTLAPGNALIRHCHFERMGRLSSTYVPALEFAGVGNTVERCEFADMPSSAVRYDGNCHRITRNFFHDLVLVSDDQGAVETFGDPLRRHDLRERRRGQHDHPFVMEGLRCGAEPWRWAERRQEQPDP